MNVFYLVLDILRQLLSTFTLRKTTFKFGFKDGGLVSVPGFITVHWPSLSSFDDVSKNSDEDHQIFSCIIILMFICSGRRVF